MRIVEMSEMNSTRFCVFCFVVAPLLCAWVTILTAAEDRADSPTGRIERESYDFRTSTEYKSLSSSDRDRIERVHHDLTPALQKT
jgi:hypothetical protein